MSIHQNDSLGEQHFPPVQYHREEEDEEGELEEQDFISNDFDVNNNHTNNYNSSVSSSSTSERSESPSGFSSVVKISASQTNMTFNSQVLINVEEFIYFSVKLGIKFQLVNNKIVVGPYYDGNVPPRPIMAMLEALHSNASDEVLTTLQTNLHLLEAIEEEEDRAALHSLTRDDLHSVRRLAAPDDTLYCEELLKTHFRNTLVSYPPPSQLAQIETNKSNNNNSNNSNRNSNSNSISITNDSSGTSTLLSTTGGETIERNRNGSISRQSIIHQSLTSTGEVQSRPVQVGVVRSSGTATQSSQDGGEGAGWKDEQDPDILTYFINSSVSNPVIVSNFDQTNPTINLPEATVSSVPLNSESNNNVGVNRGTSSRTPTIQAVAVNMTVTENAPFERPASLSVQQEFLLRNNSIRSSLSSASSSSSSVSKTLLRTGSSSTTTAGDNSSPEQQSKDKATSDNKKDVIDEIRVKPGKEGKTVSSKIVIQSAKHFGDNIKKVWKFDLPVQLSDEEVYSLQTQQEGAEAGDSEAQLIVKLITKLLVEKFSFPVPYFETIESLIHSTEPIDSLQYFIQDNNSKGQNISGEIVLKDALVHKFSVMYFDEEVNDFVSLDPDTLEDFASQTKKSLRIDYLPVKASVCVLRKTLYPEEEEEEVTSSTLTDSLQKDKEIKYEEENDKMSFNVCVKVDEKKSEIAISSVALNYMNNAEVVEVYTNVDNTIFPLQDAKAELSPYGKWRWISRVGIGMNRNCDSLENVEKRDTSLEMKVKSSLAGYYIGAKQWSTLVAVNGVRMKDLEKSLVFSMLKQKQRPIVLEFESRQESNLLNSSGSSGEKKEMGQSKEENLPSSIFLAKYNHPLAKTLRKQVEKLLKNFDGYDWVVTNSSTTAAANGSSPQLFVTSLYRSIETELENLGLFDSSTPQGGGVPSMQESHWADVRLHIETLVFSSIYNHVRAMAPPPEIHELWSTHVAGGSGQRSMVPLQTKFAFLSFLTLKDMGMDLPEGLTSPRTYALVTTPSSMLAGQKQERKQPVGNSVILPEEWRIGLKELCRATELRSPLKIMQRFRSAVMLLTYAIESLLGRPLKYTDYETSQQAISEADSSSVNNGKENSVNDKNQKVAICREFLRPAGYYNPGSLGADELMPVLSWAIIQANAPALDMAVWLCSEFRHPSNHMGECAYTLTQVSSALEYVKVASWKDFDVQEEYYRDGIKRYEATQDLIVACKKGRGEQDFIRKCFNRGADVNGLSVDQSESPLSAAIKGRHIDTVRLLLLEKNINVNIRISPYFSNNIPKDNEEKQIDSSRNNKRDSKAISVSKKEVLQDYTALMLAAFTGQATIVALLLDSGADRYLVNEAGDSATALALAGGHREVVRLLLADPNQYSFFDLIATEDVYLIRGMLMQSAVPVNDIGIVCSYRLIDSEKGNEERIEISGTVIQSAIYYRDVNITNILLNSHRVNVNKANTRGETALMWCGISNSIIDLNHKYDSSSDTIIAFLENTNGNKMPSEEKFDDASIGMFAADSGEDVARVQVACALLREGADRHAKDCNGRSAFHWAKFGNTVGYSEKYCEFEITEIAQEDLPFSSMECRFPRLAAILYYDPSRYKIYNLARDGCIAGVRALLDQGISVNEACPEGAYTPLIAAAYNKDVNMVRFLLQFATIEINYKGKNHMTALHYAAQEGSLDICGLLLYHSAERGALTTAGLLPIDFALAKGFKEIAACLRFDPKKVSICLAAKHGDMTVLAALINQGVSINSRLRHVSEKGTHHELTTPLIAACAFGQLEFIRKVMTNKDKLLATAFFYSNKNSVKYNKFNGDSIDINVTNFIGQTPLMYAAASGDEDMLLYLLKMGAKRYIKDKEGRTAAMWAKNHNKSQLYMILISDPEESCVHEAIREGNMEATIAFFKQDPNPNVRYFSALRYAVNDNHSKVGSILVPISSRESETHHSTSLNVSVRFNAAPIENTVLDGESPLVVAAKYGHLAIVRLLMRAPEIEIDNVDTFGKNALMHACERGHESVVLLLLKHKSNRYAICYNQKRAIDYALASHHDSIVDILEADPYKVHIHDAAESGNVRHVNALLKQGCPPNYQDERGGKRSRSALICAASKGKLDVVKLFLSLNSVSNSININLQDADGMTALMHAAKIGDLEITGELLTANCQRDIVDARGKNAQYHASSHGFLTGTQFKAQLLWR